MDDIQIGQIINYIIENHRENRLTQIKQVRQKFLISDMDKILDDVNQKLSECNIRLIGYNEEKISSYKRSDKIFIIKNNQNTTDKLQPSESSNKHDNFNKMVTIFTFIFLEGGKILQRNLFLLLAEINLFTDTKEIENYVNELKCGNYIVFEKEEDELYVTYNWRFYIEFSGFNPTAIFKRVLSAEKNRKI